MSVYNELCMDISKERGKRAMLLRYLYAIIVIMITVVFILCIIMAGSHKVETLALLTVIITASIVVAIAALSGVLIKIYYTLEHEHILLERLSVVRQTKSGKVTPSDYLLQKEKQ